MDRIRVMMMRSDYPDARMEKEGETLARNGHIVIQAGWDRGRVRSFNSSYGFIIERMKLKVQPESLKVVLFLPIWWSFVIYNLLFKRYDIVHASDFDTFLPALIIAKIKKKIIIYDIFDSYADMIRFPIFPKASRLIIGSLDKFLMRFADAIILADESRMEQIGKKYNKLIFIYNSPKDYSIKSEPRENGNIKFSIFFGGAISADRNIDKVIMAIKDLDDVELTVMGPCPPKYEEELKKAAKNSKNVKLFLKGFPHEAILRQTINADVLFAIYDNTIYNNKYSSPNKLFEAMMCCKPIIVNDGTSMADIVRNEECGIVIAGNNEEAIRNAIIKLKIDKTLRQTLGENGRKAYEERYSWNIMERRLLNIYNDLLKDSDKKINY